MAKKQSARYLGLSVVLPSLIVLFASCSTSNQNLVKNGTVWLALGDQAGRIFDVNIEQEDKQIKVFGKVLLEENECPHHCHIDMHITNPSGKLLLKTCIPYVNRGKKRKGWSGASFRAMLPIVIPKKATVKLVFHDIPSSLCDIFTKKDECKNACDLKLIGDPLTHAKNMLRMDDYADFEHAESSFLALRHRTPDDAQLTGWLAQLYVAWAEQLIREGELLQAKISASREANLSGDTDIFSRLMAHKTNQVLYLLENAELLAHDITRKQPDNYIGYRVLADYYRVSGDRVKMDEQLAKVSKLNPDSVGLLFIQGAAKAQLDKDHQAAIILYDQAIKKDPRFIKALFFKGLSLHSLGKAEEAKHTMQDILKLSPHHPGVKAFQSMDKYINALKKEAKQMTN